MKILSSFTQVVPNIYETMEINSELSLFVFGVNYPFKGESVMTAVLACRCKMYAF